MSDDHEYEAWLKEARRAGKYFWCYEDLVDDQVEYARQAFERGDDPYEYIKQVGISLDLHKFGTYWGI